MRIENSILIPIFI